MTRRGFLVLTASSSFLLAAARSASPVFAPTEIETLNSFAQLYNRYVAKLRSSIVDLPSWRKVVAGWDRLR
jgi:hypothetical protein